MNARVSWFDVDRRGLAAIAGRRNKRFILRELIQNAWDEASTEVRVTISAPDGARGLCAIDVEDDSPDGFADLTHAFTLFAPSKKVADANKRGRFNFGEKLVLSLCVEARIETTTGTVIFGRDESRRRSSKKRAAGSMFHGLMKMNADERADLIADARRMIPPAGKPTWVNGELVAARAPLKSINWVLETEVAGDDGTLRKTHRATTLNVYEVGPGESACLYEMGIPVVETGDRWHVDVGQKVPLNMERDNVKPDYLRDVRVGVANHMHAELTSEDANKSWARDALADYQVTEAAAATLTRLRFGDKVVVYDPSDVEANSIAVAKGYTVVHGSQMNADEWEQVRRHKTMLPAGQVTPSPKPFAEGGRDLRMCEDVTDGMRRFAKLVADVGFYLTGRTYQLNFADDAGWQYEGCIDDAGRLIINVHAFYCGFDDPAAPQLLEWIIHEMAHTVETNHLADRYHDTLCKFGAKVATLALGSPEVFR